MRIVITNDDGIHAEGIRVLANWARKLGEVIVVAPKTQQSAKSHSINIHTAFEVKRVQVPLLEGIECFSVDSSPADCVRIAFNGLHLQPDLVLSGINQGLNLGEDIAYSGTDGAIFEAAYFKCPAIAFSTWPDSFETAAERVDEAYSFIERNNLLQHCLMYNVNFPRESKGIRITYQGNAYYKDNFGETEPEMFIAQGYSTYKGTANLDEDLDCTMNGYTSITPLTVNRTDVNAYRALKGLLQD